VRWDLEESVLLASVLVPVPVALGLEAASVRVGLASGALVAEGTEW
jgi:hypothetical protein